MLALHLDNLLFLLVVAAIGLLRLLAGKAGGAKRNEESEEPMPPQRAPTPVERAPAESDADRVRKFLEALGQPTTAKPPPPVTPRAAPLPPAARKAVEEAAARKRKPVWANPLPPLTTVPPPLDPPRRVILPRPVSAPPPIAKPFIPEVAEASVFEVRQETTAAEPLRVTKPAEAYAIAPAARAESRRTDLLLLLRSPSSLQQAIILREVLGPPRGLQPLDLTGIA